MNELSLQQIHVGDTISGQTDSGMSFTAVIKEISQYPDSDGCELHERFSEQQCLILSRFMR